MRDLILSVDIGTSATKAVLFDDEANQLAVVRKPYRILLPRKGWAEQEPEVVSRAVMEAIRDTTATIPEDHRIVGVTFSSQLNSILAVRENGQALTNSLIWSDTRSVAAAQAIRSLPEAASVYERTGCPIDAIYPLAKIRWLQQHHGLPPQAKFISIKEYVLHELIGHFVVDWSLASATGLFDIRHYRWDKQSLDLLDITPSQLSELVPPRAVFTSWRPGIPEGIGLPRGTPLVVGGGDGPLANLGAGALDAQTLAVNVGTSAAARAVMREARVDPHDRLWTYVIDDGLWVMGGIVSSGGIVYDWFLQSCLAANASSSEANESLASAVPPGADNLLFVPYLAGEQCPGWQPHTRGAFFGLDLGHSQGHLLRAVLEGIARSICRVAVSIEATLDRRFERVHLTGGMSSSSLWRQIAADMLGVSVAVPSSTEGSARGAAMIALVALGLKPGLSGFVDSVIPRKYVLPQEKVHALYQAQEEVFDQVLAFARSLSRHGEVKP
jgi:gluconokinase